MIRGAKKTQSEVAQRVVPQMGVAGTTVHFAQIDCLRAAATWKWTRLDVGLCAAQDLQALLRIVDYRAIADDSY